MDNLTFSELQPATTAELAQTADQAGGDGQEPAPASFDLLTTIGVSPSVARKLAASCDPADVLGWVNYARSAKGVTNPPAFVVARLKKGEPPPEPDLPEDDPRRYISGEYGHLIQH